MAFGWNVRRSLGLCAMPVLGLCAAVLGGVTGDLELLKLLDEGGMANRQRIVTWKGTAHISSWHTKSTEAGPVTTCANHLVEFACDAKLGAKRFVMFTTSEAIPPEMTIEDVFGKPFTSGLQKGREIYRFSQGVGPDKKFARNCLINDADAAPFKRRDPRDFDPFTWYGIIPSDINPAQVYDTFSAWRNNPKVTISITREGDIVTIYDELRGSTNTWTYDISKGCSMISFGARGLGDDSSCQIDYELAGGAWIPKRIMEISKTSPASPRIFRREVLFENEAGISLSESDFTLDAIGMKPGDRIEDARTRVRYTYEGGKAGDDQAALRPDDPEVKAILNQMAQEAEANDLAGTQRTESPAAGEARSPDVMPQRGRGVCGVGVVACAAAGILVLVVVAVLIVRARKG